MDDFHHPAVPFHPADSFHSPPGAPFLERKGGKNFYPSRWIQAKYAQMEYGAMTKIFGRVFAFTGAKGMRRERLMRFSFGRHGVCRSEKWFSMGSLTMKSVNLAD